jgi:predicted outer membrane repeat protein
VTGNRAAGDGGGAWSAGANSSLSVSGAAVSGNRAGGHGGGIWAQGQAVLSGAPVSGNDAAAGGGIWADGPDAVVTLLSSPATGNTPDNCEPAGAVTGC